MACPDRERHTPAGCMGNPIDSYPCHPHDDHHQMPTYRRLPSTMPSGLARQWAWPELGETARSLPSIRRFQPSPDIPSASFSNCDIKTSPTRLMSLPTKLKRMIYPQHPEMRVIRWRKDTSGETSELYGSNCMSPRFAPRQTSSSASLFSRSRFPTVRLIGQKCATIPLWFALLFAGWILFGTTLGSLFCFLLCCWALLNGKH